MLLLPVSHGIHTPAGGAAALEAYGSSTSTGATIDYPSGGIQSGYLAVLVDTAAVNPGLTVPAGFTSIQGNTLANPNYQASYKILTGSEGTTITGMNGDTSNAKVLWVFRATSGSITGVTVQDTDFQTTSGDPSSQTITASGGATPLIVMASAYVGNALGAFSTASPAFDDSANDGARLTVGHKIYNSSPADHAVDKDDQGNNNQLASWYLEITIS